MKDKTWLMEIEVYQGETDLSIESIDDVHAMRIAFEGLYKAGAVPDKAVPFVRLYTEEE